MLRNLFLAVAGGILAAMAFPNPFFIQINWHGGWLAFICLIPLLAVRDDTRVPYWLWGWLYGLLYFGIATVWMAQMPAMGALAPGVWLLLTSYLALYPAVFLAGYRWLLRRGVPAWSAAAPLWVALEFLRNYLFSGFPWVQLGYAHYQIPALLAVAPVAGVWGLSLITVLVNSGLHAGLSRWAPGLSGLEGPAGTEAQLALRRCSRRRLWGLGALILLLTAGVLYERIELKRHPGEYTLTVAALQGNVNQDQPWTPAYQRMTLNRFYPLLSQAVARGAQFAVWPESAFPGIFNWDRSVAAEVKAWSRRLHVIQAIGTDTLERKKGNECNVFNSLVLVNTDGNFCGLTSKMHLVPFGEYVPFGDTLLAAIRKVVNRYGAGGFTPGRRREVLRFQWEGRPVKFGTLICFESLFPQYASNLARKGGEFLVVSTLDTWFGTTAAPAQHIIFSALRAAETGRYLIRAGATGISCAFDPHGALIGQVPLNTAGVLTVPIRCRTTLTLFSRLGPWIVWICLLLLAWDVFFMRRHPRSPANENRSRLLTPRL